MKITRRARTVACPVAFRTRSFACTFPGTIGLWPGDEKLKDGRVASGNLTKLSASSLANFTLEA